MFICPCCNSQIENCANFCPICGARLEQPNYSQPPAYQQPVCGQPQQPTYIQPVYQQPMYQQPIYQQPVLKQPEQPSKAKSVVGMIFGLVGFVFALLGMANVAEYADVSYLRDEASSFAMVVLGFTLPFAILGLVFSIKSSNEGCRSGMNTVGKIFSIIALAFCTIVFFIGAGA